MIMRQMQTARGLAGLMCLWLGVATFHHADAAEATERELSQAEADRLLDDLFARQQQLRWLQAKVLTSKSGGVFTRGRQSVGQLEAAVPARFRFVDQGDPSAPQPVAQSALMLFDGEFYWEMEPDYPGQPRQIERRTLKSAADSGRGVDLVSFFVGKDVASAAELRQDFTINAWGSQDEKGELNHLRLSPKEGESRIELWFRPGAAVPEKVRMEETVRKVTVGGQAGASSVKVTERQLSEVRTNLDGLPAFPVETFIFPLQPGQVILDEAGRAIPPAALLQDLARRRQAAADAAEKK